jgi:hypothetical protein
MKDMTQLTSDLCTVFDQLQSGAIKNKDADSLANVAGKIVKSIALQVEYAALRNRGLIGKIPFLETQETLQDVEQVGGEAEQAKLTRAR